MTSRKPTNRSIWEQEEEELEEEERERIEKAAKSKVVHMLYDFDIRPILEKERLPYKIVWRSKHEIRGFDVDLKFGGHGVLKLRALDKNHVFLNHFAE